MEKMGQRTKSTGPRLPHTGRPHDRRVPIEPKFSPIRKRPILRALRHSKAYKYTLEEEKRETQGRKQKLLKESRLIHLRSWIHHQD
ncbi:Rho GTPase-activating gacW [Gossypium arboreum]|uniref:Rho GTPase-activating gacW n=1 Tax=Gossypium arboreum TaxID=29729 RepID=A0A0B0MH16_GOSAR|nr:Rho GTPase-activating gacW [Gossypium arboreum]